MKTLHVYLVRQVSATLVMTVVVFTFVLLLGNVLREILVLLLNGQVPLGVVLQAIALLIPYVLVFALPMGMLTATLLFFGRFSADQELTAVRSSGVSLIALVTPILLLSVALSVLCAWVNLELAPQGRVAYKRLLHRIGLQRPEGFLKEQQYVQAGKYTIYAGKIHGTNFQDVEIHELNEAERSQSWYRAASGSLAVDARKRDVTLVLRKAYGAVWQGDNLQILSDLEETTLVITNAFRANNPDAPQTKLSDMTFFELRTKLEELERLNSFQPRAAGTNSAQLRQEMAALKQMKNDLTMPARVQLHRQIAFSFACIGFTLIGIPLAIQAHRRETMAGVAISLLLVVVYYSFIILGQALETHSEAAPHLIVWIPNFLFQTLGAVLLWRANKGI